MVMPSRAASRLGPSAHFRFPARGSEIEFFSEGAAEFAPLLLSFRDCDAHSSGRLAIHCRSVRASGSDQNHRGQCLVVPIHREGWPFIALFAGMNLIAFLITFWLGILLLPLTIWCVAFFRDPDRVAPNLPGLIICPADGKLLPIVEAMPPEELGLGPSPRTR